MNNRFFKIKLHTYIITYYIVQIPFYASNVLFIGIVYTQEMYSQVKFKEFAKLCAVAGIVLETRECYYDQ